MLPDRVSNPGPLTYESGALPIALRGRLVQLKVVLETLNFRSDLTTTKNVVMGRKMSKIKEMTDDK